MAKTNFDDWNISEPEAEEHSFNGKKAVNASGNSFLFLCVSIVIVLFGIVSVYSAGFNSEDLSFMLNQLVYIGAGILLSLIFAFIPDSLFKLLSFFIVVWVAIVNIMGILHIIPKIDEDIRVQLIFVSTVLYFSSYFANRENRIERLKDIFAPVVCALVFTVLMVNQVDFIFCVLYILLVIVMFSCGGVSFSGILVLILFILVPVVCFIFSDADKIKTFLTYIVPGFRTSSLDLLTRRQCIASGSLLGKGLAMGQYKFSSLEGVTTYNIVCIICEETGFAGLCLLVILFLILYFSGYRIGYITRNYNSLYSNMAIGLTTIVAFQTIMNFLTVLGYVVPNTISLPLVSNTHSLIFSVFSCAIIFKCSTKTREGRRAVSDE